MLEELRDSQRIADYEKERDVEVIDRTRINQFSEASIQMKQYFASSEYRDLRRSVTHDRLTAMSKSKGEVSDDLLAHIYDGNLRFMLANADCAEAYEEQKKVFCDEVWPLLRSCAEKNAGMAQFMLENGVFSEFITKFLWNVQKCPAKAVLPAHGVSDTMLGEPKVVSKDDPMFPYLFDQSYRMIQYRTQVPQEDLKKMGRILFAGGGLLPELWANGYPLGKIDQEIVVYDMDSSAPIYLEKILGGKPKDFGIDYRIGDYREAPLTGDFDGLVGNGIMSYTIRPTNDGYDMSEFAADVGRFSRQLRPGGKLYFDIQLFHPVLIFDILVLIWPSGMTVIKEGYQRAIELVKPVLDVNGFTELQFSHEPVDEAKGEKPAGMITVAQR